MNKTDIIISYFRLNEKERKEQFAAESSAQIIKSGRFAAGSAHFAVLEDNGTVKAYGDNSFGQCNTKGWTNVKKVVAGDFHTAALTNDGKVYATGDNSFGQCCVEPWHNIEELFADKKLTVGITKEGAILASHKRADKNADKPKEQPEKSGELKSKGYKKTLDGTFEYTEIDGKIQITKYFGDSENVIIPEKVKGMEVDSIGENAFTNNSSVKWVKFPESIREINCKAFIGCSGLEYISIPFGLETIKDYAFAYCNLKSLNLPESLKYIGNYAFLNSERLKGISIPNSIETIEDTAFRGCNNIEILEITPYAKQRIKNYTQIFNLK